MRLLRNPVTQFLLIGVITVTAIIFGVNYLAGEAASDEAITEQPESTTCSRNSS